jgi:hypothetical protein
LTIESAKRDDFRINFSGAFIAPPGSQPLTRTTQELSAKSGGVIQTELHHPAIDTFTTLRANVVFTGSPGP